METFVGIFSETGGNIPWYICHCYVFSLAAYLLGIYIIDSKWYDTCHGTHEVIFDIYQWYILSDFRPKTLIYPQLLWEFGDFNHQNTLNLSKNVSFEVSGNQNEWYNVYCIAKISIQLIYCDTIQSPNIDEDHHYHIVTNLCICVWVLGWKQDIVLHIYIYSLKRWSCRHTFFTHSV